MREDERAWQTERSEEPAFSAEYSTDRTHDDIEVDTSGYEVTDTRDQLASSPDAHARTNTTVISGGRTRYLDDDRQPPPTPQHDSETATSPSAHTEQATTTTNSNSTVRTADADAQSTNTDADPATLAVTRQCGDVAISLTLFEPSINSDGIAGDVILVFDGPETPHDVTVTTDSVVKVSPSRQTFETDQSHVDFDIRIRESQTTSTGRLQFFAAGEKYELTLPTAKPLQFCFNILDPVTQTRVFGDIRSYYADQLDNEMPYTAFLSDCEHVLSYDQYITLLGTLAENQPTVSAFVYRSRYGYFVNRLGGASPHPHSIPDVSTLETRVEQYNAEPSLGTVREADVLGQYLLSVDRSASVEERLEALGVEPTTYDRRKETDFVAYCMAQLVLVEGFREAEYFALQRPVDRQLNYHAQKQQAENVGYGDRAEAWGMLLNHAVRESLHEFKYVLANYLYWTGHESRTYAKVQQYLFKAASQLFDDLGISAFHQQACVQYHLTIAHELRRDRQYKEAVTEFKRAEAIARGDDSQWPQHLRHERFDAVVGRVTVQATIHRLADDYAEMIAVLETAIETLEDAAWASSMAREREMHLLYGKRDEAVYDRAMAEGDRKSAKAAIADAIDHYETANKEYSVQRAEQRAAQL